MDSKEIGTRIKEARKNKKFTQLEAAKKAEISRSYYADLENGRYSPSLNTLSSISKALGVSTTYLLNGDKYAALLYNQDIEAIDFNRIKSLNRFLTSIAIKNKITSKEVPEIFDDNGMVLIDQQLYKLFKDYDCKQLKLLSSKLSFNSLENLSLYYALCEKLNIENELSLFNEDELYFYLSRLRQDYYSFEKFMKNN